MASSPIERCLEADFACEQCVTWAADCPVRLASCSPTTLFHCSAANIKKLSNFYHIYKTDPHDLQCLEHLLNKAITYYTSREWNRQKMAKDLRREKTSILFKCKRGKKFVKICLENLFIRIHK